MGVVAVATTPFFVVGGGLIRTYKTYKTYKTYGQRSSF